MPNHVTTRLTFRGPVEVIDAMLAAIRTEHPETQHTSYFGDKTYVKKNKKEEEYAWLDKDGNFKSRGDVVISKGGADNIPKGWKPQIEKAWTQFISFDLIVPHPKCVFNGDLSSNEERANPNRDWYAGTACFGEPSGTPTTPSWTTRSG